MGSAIPLTTFRAVHCSRLPQWTTVWWFRNPLKKPICYELYCWHIPGWCNRQEISEPSTTVKGLPPPFVSSCADPEAVQLEDLRKVFFSCSMEVLWKKKQFFVVLQNTKWLEKCFKFLRKIQNKSLILRDTCLHPKMGDRCQITLVKFKLGETLLQSSQKSDHDLVMVLICLYPHTRKANSQKKCVFISSTKKRLEVVSWSSSLQRSHHWKSFKCFVFTFPSSSQKPFQLIHVDDITLPFGFIYNCQPIKFPNPKGKS